MPEKPEETPPVVKTPREHRRDARLEKYQRKHTHIVDVLIRERAEKLSRSKLWPLYRLCLNQLLDYPKAVRMVNEAGEYRARDAFDYVSEKLDLKLDITGLENVPTEGTFMMALNHPTGIADGIAVYDALKGIRPDVAFFANADAIRLNQNLTEMLIPVEWVEKKKTRAKSRETLKATTEAFKAERAIVIFPSGRLAYMDENKKLQEQPWMSTVSALPKKYQCPVIPAHLTSRNSWLYYWFWQVNTELRDMTLFHELLNKKGQTYRMVIGEPIMPDQLPENNDEAAALLRTYVSGPLVDGVSWETFRKQNGPILS
ncbi:acyltransferase [Parvularcula flava]|uniref:Acyltransferase n=1 Tax=Aquisalinus luteolus TaxID=1566827 RepID=A0A8J3A7A0_9PROT|nr:1-acyl-sn-glycerol-3-phosphate acyltransferase [Aquisalinus luteolus]NHK28252.1 acyltransferase [Aquisalinus luteolus]GGH97922.1 lysophospholipid acyltransferase [Aquisalinus luteolus]